ncbi:MAG TPA: hypothetical protein VG889_07890 [Rhizomicrobium sp.]|nr:hypothetical protein [Rhizomicrobium sp.]
MLTILALAAAASAAAPAPAPPRVPDLREAVIAYLNAYASGDKAAVIGALDQNVQLYGGDLSDVYHGVSGAADLFDADQKQWGGNAKFGTMFNVSGVRDGQMASVMFDIPFTGGKGATVNERYAMVWRIEGGAWKLLMSSNAILGATK